MINEATLEAIELPAGEKALLSLHLPNQFIIVFEPVTHSAQFIDVQGEPTAERQHLSIVFNNLHAPTGTVTMRPGPLRLSLENQYGCPDASRGLDCGRRAARAARKAQADPDSETDARQPDVP